LLARTEHSATASLLASSSYYHSDAGGNITAMTDSSGNVVAKYLYDPFGNLLAKSGAMADVNRYRFSSKEVHLNSGSYYYGYRFYEPNLQRWLNEDPIREAGGMNLFGFVGNNPLRAVDPLGLDIDSDASLESLAWVGQNIIDGFCWGAGKVDDGIDKMRHSGNPFVRGAGGGLLAMTWVYGGPEIKATKEARLLKEAKAAEEAAIAARKAAAEAEAALAKAEKEAAKKAKDCPPKSKWKPGDNPNDPTRAGSTPSDQTVRRREWKNEAENPTRSDFTPEDMERMKNGKPPQRYNPDKGGIESMERSHEPTPRRDGGTETVPKWPQEHADVDPNRHPGY